MQNCSAGSYGGTAAYNFGDVTLVKYFGDRTNSEEVAEEVNKLNAKGIHTPKHLAIKRTEVDGGMITWVLQETARGINKTYYTGSDYLRAWLDAPDSHFENLIKDRLAISNSRLDQEPRARNFFYDPDKDKGGLFFIDFTYNPQKNNSSKSNNDTGDDSWLYKICAGIVTNDIACKGSEEETSKNDYYTLKKRIFNACEKVLPDQRRNILRSIRNRKTLKYFAKNGVIIGDLTLNDKEQENFATETNRFLDYCLEKIEAGSLEYWEVEANKIRLNSTRLKEPWLFHPFNTIKRDDYKDEYDYYRASDSKLNDILLDLFDRKLDAAVNNNPKANPNLINAWEDAQKGKQSENTSNKENDAIMASILKAKLVR